MAGCTDTCCREDEYVSILTLDRRRHKARKEHGCARCNDPIKPGQVYVVHVMLYDGDLVTEKTHEYGIECAPAWTR